jgi:hypothetical protein
MADPGQASSSPPASDSIAEEDQTWLDFLRSAGGTVRSSATTAAPAHSHASSSSATLPRPPHVARNESTDRKRRLTTAEEGRNYPYVAPGTTRASAIDLSTTPPRQQGHQRGHTTGSVTFSTLPPRRESVMSRRRPSDMPPPWQPDAEVHQCPVCEQEFGFLFRKHHCRKCGRVVCANCSPHRITIPREYIVQPPGLQDGPPLMGGAEVVRVCKPCVPDPWTPPTPQQQDSGAAPRPVPTPPRRSSETSQSRYHRRPSVPVPSTRPQTNDSRFPSYRDFLPTTHASQPNNAPISSSAGPHPYHPLHPNNRPARPRGLTAPANRAQPPVPGSSSSPQIPAPRERRRQVKEEDECPVCGIELPPGDAVREAHIQTCVSSRFSTPPSHPPAVPNLGPIPPTNPRDPNLPSSLGAPAPDHTANARARALSYRSRGIFPYIATEKDCMDGEGREQECTICMEEFQPGEEMGRLECLCKFHRKCIRDWWGIKGRGSCPVHVFNE